MMGGRLVLGSVLGRGTEAEISLSLVVLKALPASDVADTGLAVSTRPLTILVVDDYPANRLLLTRQLSYLGHYVLEAEDGEQGLEQWRAQTFDVVISDCNMPRFSGYELAGAIRDEERAYGMPPTLILGFTANAQPEEKVRCLEAGMDDCLFKPILLADLSAWLASRFTGELPAPLEPVEAPPTSEIDLSGLELYVGEDRTLINQLLRELAESNREDRIELLQAHVGDNRFRLEELAHRIKGSARMVRAARLIECCEDLERACAEGCAALIDEAVDRLQRAMKSLGQHLKRD
jgi:two-component system sensor histidine kinase EvgS